MVAIRGDMRITSIWAHHLQTSPKSEEESHYLSHHPLANYLGPDMPHNFLLPTARLWPSTITIFPFPSDCCSQRQPTDDDITDFLRMLLHH